MNKWIKGLNGDDCEIIINLNLVNYFYLDYCEYIFETKKVIEYKIVFKFYDDKSIELFFKDSDSCEKYYEKLIGELTN